MPASGPAGLAAEGRGGAPAVSGELLVVKLGGSLGDHLQPAAQDAAGLWREGHRLVLLHGCSVEADALTRRLGLEPLHVTAPSGMPSRYTPPKHLEIFLMAAAAVNVRLVTALQRAGLPAVGLLPHGGRLLRARRQAALIVREADGRKRVLRDDQTGRVEEADAGLLRLLLESGRPPVLAPLAAGEEDQPLNVDGDRAAAVVAVRLGAGRLVLLTEAPGLLERFPDPASLIRTADREELPRLQDVAQGRMKKKVLAARLALEGGVEEVILAGGGRPDAIRRALEGGGTHIR